MMTSSRAPPPTPPLGPIRELPLGPRGSAPPTPCGAPCEPRSWWHAAWLRWLSRLLLATLVRPPRPDSPHHARSHAACASTQHHSLFQICPITAIHWLRHRLQRHRHATPAERLLRRRPRSLRRRPGLRLAHRPLLGASPPQTSQPSDARPYRVSGRRAPKAREA